MWRITKQSVALLLVAALFSVFPCSYFKATYNDSKFQAYENMNPDDDRPGYVVPTLYRQDSVYQYAKTYPLVISGSVEYVPISIFTQFSNISVTYSKTSENFYMTDSKSGRFVTFDVKKNIAETSEGDLIRINTRIFYSTRYVAARDVAELFNLTVEIYDDIKASVYALRICDSARKYTFSQLMEQYLPKKKVQTDVKVPDIYDNPEQKPNIPETSQPKEPEVQDIYEGVAKRNVYVIFGGVSNDGAAETIGMLSLYKVPSVFSVTYDEVMSAGTTVRSVLVNGGTLAVTAPNIDENLEEQEYIQTLIYEYERVNEALSVICKQKTRLCVLPSNIPEEIKESKYLFSKLKENGYIIVSVDYFANDDASKVSVKPYTVSQQVKDKIVNASDKDKKADIFISFNVSKHSKTYISDIARFVNKYRQFGFYSVNEAVCMQKATKE